jgi:hypothetical protein
MRIERECVIWFSKGRPSSVRRLKTMCAESPPLPSMCTLLLPIPGVTTHGLNGQAQLGNSCILQTGMLQILRRSWVYWFPGQHYWIPTDFIMGDNEALLRKCRQRLPHIWFFISLHNLLGFALAWLRLSSNIRKTQIKSEFSSFYLARWRGFLPFGGGSERRYNAPFWRGRNPHACSNAVGRSRRDICLLRWKHCRCHRS